MQKTEEKIEYSVSEQQEIERILDHISKETLGHLPANVRSENTEPDYKEQDSDFSRDYSGAQFNDESPAIIDKFDEIPDDLKIEDRISEDISEDVLDESIQELSDVSEEETEEIQDITDLIQEIPEKATKSSTSVQIPEEDLEEISLPQETDDELINEFVESKFPEAEAADSGEDKIPSPEKEEEPDFDFSLATEDLEQMQSAEALPSEDIGIPSSEEDQIPEREGTGREPLISESVIKDFELSDFNIDEPQKDKTAVSETAITMEPDISDLDMPQMTQPDEANEEPSASKKTGLFEQDFSSIEHEDLLDMTSLPEEELPSAKTQPKSDEDIFSSDIDKIDDLIGHGKSSAAARDIGFNEPFGDIAAPQKSAEEEIDLSDSELKKLNKVMQFFHPNLVKVIKNVILNDLLPSREIRKLVDFLLSNKREEDVKSFLEKQLNTKIDISKKAGGQRRRVISARPEYTKEGRERQTKLLKATGIFAISAAVILLITLFSYQYIYKPVMAKKKINEGVALIKKPGVPVLEKQRDYKKAEDLFIYVDENYIKDYLYGYHSYSDAYFQNKEYDYAVEKLNKAYEINAANADTLNKLGYFYSKIPETKFMQLKPELHKNYYKKIKPVGPVEKQIDVAIDFYKKSLNIDPKNITALYGIGNAYTYLGESLKARQYYENILAVDENSVVGHSGLLNLYIEKDALDEVISIHSQLRNKNNLSQLPSALLAKLASYYLTKKRTDDTNIRIDQAIDSPAIKDFNDNPYPAVKNVLDALAERDMDYPPLFLQTARLSKEENNLSLMKRNLQTALEKSPNYFAAHVLLADYYYQMKDPIEAYKASKKALQAYLNPPEFTKDDFYYETENIGHAYSIMGNIFYYFDKIKFRFGDEFEDENLQEKSDELANFTIAQDKYEKAIAEKFKSSEVFYNLGRIYYIKGQYEKALSTWLNLYEDFVAQPELIFALGNAFYHQNNLEACKGEYLKVISIFESKADSIRQVYLDRTEHIKIFQTLSSAYNNLGAVYQLQNSETKSNISYWKAIDYAKKIERENEFARVNLARSVRAGRSNVLPILDENIASDIYANK
jgi:tetratricopeptide (TPR) repeat protein